MWQVTCEVGAGQTGKLVTDSWSRAAWQYVLWRLKGRAATLARYKSETDPARQPGDVADRHTAYDDPSDRP